MNEKNNSDVDELLSSLKRNHAAADIAAEDLEAQSGINSGELPVGAQIVAREDGSQVIRVKKRKRRSKQPKKEKEGRAKKRKVFIVFSAVVLMFGIAITSAVLLAYRNSSKFNEKVTKTIEICSGATAEVGTLGVSPQRVSVQKVDLKWETSCFENLQLNDVVVNTHPLGFFGGTWRIEDFNVRKANLKLREGEQPQSNGESPLKFKGGIFDVAKLDCEFGASGAKIRDTTVRLRTGNGVTADFEGGYLEFLHWKKLQIGSGYVAKSEKGMNLNVLFQNADDYNEQLEVQGELAADHLTRNKLDLSANMYPIENLFGNGLGRYIHGSFRTNSGKVVFSPNDLASLELDIPIDGQTIRISHFPFLVSLGKILENTDILRYEFRDEARARFLYNSTGMELQEINLVTYNELQIKGSLKVSTKGELSGELRIGVSEDKEGYFEGKNALHVTRNGGDGYLWMTVQLAGTVAAPKDDMATQLATASKPNREPSLKFEREYQNQPSREEQLEDAFDRLLGN